MEISDELGNHMLDAKEYCSSDTEPRTEKTNLLDDRFITLVTGNLEDKDINGGSKSIEYSQAENKYFDFVQSVDEQDITDKASEIVENDFTSKTTCNGLGEDSEEKVERKAQLKASHQVDCSPIPDQSDEVMDLRTRDCVEKESRLCVDDTEENQTSEFTESRIFTKQSSDCDYTSAHFQTEENAQDDPMFSEEDSNSENLTETAANSLKNIDVLDEEINDEVSEICENNGEKVIDCRTDAQYGTEIIGGGVEPSITIKDENVEELTTRRPKRKRSRHISYDESEAWDSESLFDVTTPSNNLTKQFKKKRICKETNQRIRIIHSDSHFVEMFNNLYKLQKSGNYCDVKICASDGHVFVHSVVIIAASPFLHKKFKQKLKTESNENHVRDLVFQNVPVWALEKIVAFLYTGILEVFEKDVKEISKHCKALGLSAVHKKLCSKTCPANLEAAKSVLPVKSGKVVKNSIKAKDALVLKPDIDTMKGKSRKTKLKSEKTLRSKEKNSKPGDDLDKANVKEAENVIVKVETSENTFEVVENINNTFEENSKSNVAYISDFENDVNDGKGVDVNGGKSIDDEWKASYNESGDDTDSYFEKDNVKKKTIIKKKCQRKKKNKKVKKEKKTKPLSKKEGIAIKTKEKIAEGYIQEMFPESEEEKIDMSETEVGNKEKVPVSIEAGNGGECDKCGKSFYFQYELTGHRNRCTGRNNRQRRKCVTCHQSFDSTEEYMDHRNNDEKCLVLRQEKLVIRKQKRFEMRRKFCCCVCPRKFRRFADQIEHEFLAHEIQYDKNKWPDLYCEYCNYWSMNPWKLHHHKLVSCNKGQEPICDMCGNSYKNEKTLKKHKELMHTDVQPMLTCEECGKTLKGKKGLKHHIRLRHRGENLHNLMMCHICSQTYRTSSDLTFHLYRVHEQPLPEGFIVYRCSKCDYCHNNKRFYEKHMFLHEDKREWHCEICTKAFKTKNSLNTHMIVHTSSRIPCPFDDCTYKALKNCHLKNHIENQHTQKGEKHEKCHLCDYATFFRGNLIKHQRSVHKLEVVTRHSVEMKAKYKNLKSGQIVGVERPLRAEKKSSRSRSYEGDYHASNLEMGSSRELAYPASSSSENSLVENQNHFQDKSVPMPSSQHMADPFVYTLVNAPVMPHHSNFQANANMYRIPPMDFSVYNQNSLDQM